MTRSFSARNHDDVVGATMSTSLVHLLTIIGTASQEVEAACNEMLGRRIEHSPDEFGSDDWSERDHKDLEEFCVGLLDAAHELPPYSITPSTLMPGRSLTRGTVFYWNGQMERGVKSTDQTTAWPFTPRAIAMFFLAAIKKMRRTKAFRTHTEDRWYLEHLKDAIEAALSAKGSLLGCLH